MYHFEIGYIYIVDIALTVAFSVSHRSHFIEADVQKGTPTMTFLARSSHKNSPASCNSSISASPFPAINSRNFSSDQLINILL